MFGKAPFSHLPTLCAKVHAICDKNHDIELDDLNSRKYCLIHVIVWKIANDHKYKGIKRNSSRGCLNQDDEGSMILFFNFTGIADRHLFSKTPSPKIACNLIFLQLNLFM